MTSTQSKISTIGVILAGGLARRMAGADKGLIKIAGRPMVEYAIEALSPQVKSMLINANRNKDMYLKYGLPVIADALTGYNGPLAGMASCMEITETEYMVAIPCDSPFVPDDLLERLYDRIISKQAEISVAHDGQRMQPVFCLLKTSLLPCLQDYLNRGERKIDKWFAEHHTVTTDFSDKPETFLNINSPEDMQLIEAEFVKV